METRPHKEMGVQISITNKTRNNPNIHQLMCVDKQIVIYPYKRTLLSDKKESTSNTCSNMDESHEFENCPQKEADKRILYDSIYIKLWELQT